MTPSPQAPALLCVGSYTEPIGHAPTAHGRGLQLLDVDLTTGEQQVRFASDGLVSPAFVAVHPTLPVLYALTERWHDPGLVTSLRFDDDWREVVERRVLPPGGAGPSYASVVGGFLLLSNYGDGSLVGYRLGPHGDLDEQVSVLALSGSGPDPERQDGPHAHCILGHPGNGLVYVADLGADLLLSLSLDQATGALTVRQQLAVVPGSGPRHLGFHGDELFCVEELTSTLAVYHLTPDGEMVPRQRLSMLPPGVAGPSFAADLVVAPSGDRVFASNRGHDSVVSFGRRDGGWAALGWTPTGAVPRGLALSPDGRHLVVAAQEADRLEVFAVAADGLEPVVQLACATPACVRWTGTAPRSAALRGAGPVGVPTGS